jgi:hypothetical protein
MSAIADDQHSLMMVCARQLHALVWRRSVPALGSTGSAAVSSAADCFRGGLLRFVRRLHSYYGGVRLLVPCIIGYDSSSSRCGPSLSRDADGQTRDLPAAGAILLHVLWPSTPAERQHLA